MGTYEGEGCREWSSCSVVHIMKMNDMLGMMGKALTISVVNPFNVDEKDCSARLAELAIRYFPPRAQYDVYRAYWRSLELFGQTESSLLVHAVKT